MDLKRSYPNRICVSSCSQLIATCLSDETVRVWQVKTGFVAHEFQPCKQLTTPITSLCFVTIPIPSKAGGKRCRAVNNGLMLGTLDGCLLYYDWSLGRVLQQWRAGPDDAAIVALQSVDSDTIAVLANNNRLSMWNIVLARELSNTLVDGTSSMCLLGCGVVAVASQAIEVVTGRTGVVSARFTGHAAPTTCLLPLPTNNDKTKPVQFLLSASHNDTFVYMWNTKSGGDHMSPPHLTLRAKEQVIAIAASHRITAVVSVSGRVRIFNSATRSDNQKPSDSVAELTIFTDKTYSSIIPIIKVFNIASKDLAIIYGTGIYLKFERIKLSELHGVVKLVRVTSESLQHKSRRLQVLASDINHDKVTHVIPAYMPQSKAALGGKRGIGADEPLMSRFPMETQMLKAGNKEHNNDGSLSSNKKPDHVHTLIQGLHSDDTKLLHRVLTNSNSEVVRSIVSSLQANTTVVPLLQHLNSCLTLVWHRNISYTIWFREILHEHRSYISSLPNCSAITRPFKQYCASNRTTQPSKIKLLTRLALFKHQLEMAPTTSSREQKIFKPLIANIIDEDSSDDEQLNPAQNGHVHLTNGFAPHSNMEVDSDDEGIDAETYESASEEDMETQDVSDGTDSS